MGWLWPALAVPAAPTDPAMVPDQALSDVAGEYEEAMRRFPVRSVSPCWLLSQLLPELEQNKFLANDAVVGTFLFINAIGAVLAYLVSGPITDRLGKKFTLSVGSISVIRATVAMLLLHVLLMLLRRKRQEV